MAFWIIAALMALLAILIIVVPIARGARHPRDGTADANIAIYRRRIRELEAERAGGLISQQNLAEAQAEIDRQLLDDVGEEGGAAESARGSRRRLPGALMASLLVPAVVVGFYAWNGMPNPVLGGPPDILQASAQAQMEFIEEQLTLLEARLRQHPDDGEGWLILARTYSLLGRHKDAAQAFQNAQDALGVSAPLLAERAHALARAADGRFAGKPAQLLARALKLDPGNTLALWLSGIAAHQQGDQTLATEHWRAALATVPAESLAASTIRNALVRTGGLAQESAPSPAVAGARIEVSVQLDPKFAQEFAANTPVFVFARAVDGPRMPLAVVRTTVGRLPQTVTLDDSMAMAAGAKLSAFPEVLIVARVSPSGQAMPQAGNVQGSSGPIRTDTDEPVTLVMNSRI
ncbi:MAG: c-type cytochrome biogenesis protein CcmI [Nitrococcus sp.]|nr:c-type cytochrome biogenesis protein CcmI [Nitrococcus sp.]